jgi:ribonuclease HI
MIRIFTDGACKSNGKLAAQGSYAYYFPENKEWSGAFRIPSNESQTNQRGELKAIYEGVKKASQECVVNETDLQIFTDSTYSRDCLTSWIKNWMKNNWMTAAGKPVLHRDLIEGTYELLQSFKSHIITYVKAHTGGKDEFSVNNDIVDKMAVEVLIDKEVKVISTTQDIFPDLPLKMMGAPIEESIIFEWCKTHLHELDTTSLKTGLFSSFRKSLQKKGYDIETQQMNKTKVVRVISKMNLIKDEMVIIKE